MEKIIYKGKRWEMAIAKHRHGYFKIYDTKDGETKNHIVVSKDDVNKMADFVNSVEDK